MKAAIISILIVVAISHYQNYLFNMGEAAHHKAGVEKSVVRSSSPSYDVEDLNALVEHLSMSKKQKQADALVDLWHITKDDLESNVNIFGERAK